MSMCHSRHVGNCLPKKNFEMEEYYQDPKGYINTDSNEFIGIAMENTYKLIMGETTVQLLLDKGDDFMPFTCNPSNPSYEDVNNMLKYYEEEEDFEKCSKILKYLETKC